MATLKRSDNVAYACGACGGGDYGFVKRDGPGGHAEWCPVVSPMLRHVFARRVPFATPDRLDHQERVRERRALTVELRDEGYPVSEIAAIVGVSTWTVRDDLEHERR